MTQDPRAELDRFLLFNPQAVALSTREIEYRDIKPTKIVVQVPLWEYFERIKRHKVDAWQRNLCDTLQTAAENRDVERWWGVIHAEGQLGKTSIISQCFPAWLLGHDPLFRYALAMYNVSRSQAHSTVVINIMQSNLHRDIFPDKDGWLFEDEQASFGRKVSKAGWRTKARRELNDGQESFNPVGLRSGLTGSGFDWLSIDDPYKEAKEAFSELINLQMQNFYDYTVLSRTSLHSCISGMFHRYAPEDFGGFLLDTGDFDYLRYATQCDGDYLHESTGKRFADPLGRKDGEYISPERRPEKYYEKPRKNKRVWLSMFQGKPSDEEGDFFNLTKITKIDTALGKQRMTEAVAHVRAYDIASSEEHGAYSVGGRMGMLPDGRCTVFNLWRARVDTAKRMAKQKELADADGTETVVCIPIDPGAAGISVVWYTEQHLPGYTVVGRPTSGSKEQRALNFSTAVNAGQVEFVDDEELPEDEKWIRAARKELRDFPLSEYKDIVDALSDGYNELFERSRRGLVVKNMRPQRNLISRPDFWNRFPAHFDTEKRLPKFRIPEKWQIYAGVKISGEASRATSAVIAARASAHAQMPETLFVFDEYKHYSADMYALFDWMEKSINTLSPGASASDVTIWLHPDSEAYYQTIATKLPFRVTNFTDDELAGHNELNWYLLPTEEQNPFTATEKASHLYFVTDPDQLTAAEKDEPYGFYHARQEAATWGFDATGQPTKVGDVMDCLRMVTHRFKTFAEPVSIDEHIALTIQKFFPHEIKAGEFTPALQQQLEAAKYLTQIEIEDQHGIDIYEEEEQWR